MRRAGSNTTINGRSGYNQIGQSGNRNRNQLEPSPQELPVKDTDQTIDVSSKERECIFSLKEKLNHPYTNSHFHKKFSV